MTAQPSAADPQQLRAVLEALATDDVQLRETHISWVFLAGEHAYKLKKPVVLPFVDYSTAARRHRMCAEELRLNRRLAPNLYLGVRAVVPAAEGLRLAAEEDPRAIDYVVVMRRYDERLTLRSTLERGELTDEQLVAVARTLAAFHARCTPILGGEHGALRVQREIGANVQELLGVVDSARERLRVLTLARFLAAFLQSRWEELDQRAASGRVRDCHGDLRAEHVLLGSPVQVVDCVEFDPDLRTLDVADDLSFLAMDLTALGAEPLVGKLIDAYRGAGGDCGADALLAFFAVHRALIRAKVALVRARQHPPGDAPALHARTRAAGLLAAAERLAWRARLPLAIVLCGVPASGKSHLAAVLARLSGLPLNSSDVTRKSLAGLRASERASGEHYSAAFSRATYAELGRRAAADVRANGGALIDATFRRRADRVAFAQTFAGAAPLVAVECLAPVEVLTRRALARERDPARVSDATLEVVQRERGAWEALDELPAHAHLPLRTDRPAEAIVADLVALLDQRLLTTADRPPDQGV